jgi:predicted N-acyltransferase
VPFADQCNLLVDSSEDKEELIRALQETAANERLAYVELRSQDTDKLQPLGWHARSSFRLHVLDLQRPLDDVFRATHKTCIQNAIRRAERAKLQYDEGTSDRLLRAFYKLLIMTRRRHGIPPQPIEWFRNLRDCLGERLKIRVVSKEQQAVAGIVTLHSGDTMLYKYGCSDAAYHNLGGMAFLLWKAIEEAKALGARRFDFGRSDADNTGLILFKDRWGSLQSTLTYLRYSVRRPGRTLTDSPGARLVGHLFARLPDEWLTTAGRLLYKHMA